MKKILWDGQNLLYLLGGREEGGEFEEEKRKCIIKVFEVWFY